MHPRDDGVARCQPSHRNPGDVSLVSGAAGGASVDSAWCKRDESEAETKG
jgi:hypothetical protein